MLLPIPQFLLISKKRQKRAASLGEGTRADFCMSWLIAQWVGRTGCEFAANDLREQAAVWLPGLRAALASELVARRNVLATQQAQLGSPKTENWEQTVEGFLSWAPVGHC
jgi:hypothetical protein